MSMQHSAHFDRRILALCGYAGARCDDQQTGDVMHAHDCAFEPSQNDGQVIAAARARGVKTRTQFASASSSPDLRPLVDAIAEALCTIDRNGTVTLCNRSFLHLTRYQRSDQVVGRDVRQLIHHRAADGAHCAHTGHAVLEAALTGTPAHGVDEEFYRADGTSFPVEFWARPVIREGQCAEVVCTFVDITERKQAEAQHEILNRELTHRMKNTLAVVQTIVSQTLRNSGDPKEALQAINARIVAMGRAHEALMHTEWEAAPIIDIVKGGIAMCGPDHPRVGIAGPRIDIGPKTALALTMALHELCTNAIKYGALSNDSGKVAVKWTLDGASDDPNVHLRWNECGGPPVTAPTHTGFGTRIIEQYSRTQLGGDTELLFKPDGLEWTVNVPLATMKK